MIAIETLHVKNMLRNHKLAYALSDAAPCLEYVNIALKKRNAV